MLNYKKISNSPMLTLTFWTVIAQVITFLISPITTRIFSAEEFGFYTLISSVVSMVMPILSMKFDSLIVSEKRRVEANKAVMLSFFIMVFISFLVVILYYIYSIYTGIGISLVQLILFLLILIVTGVSNVGVAYANRNREYSLIG
ncbi:oligosaccharide flippase family protein, partial [Enterococcus faecium]|nr:oligosaccharide flippase family protein [Enterococcus faecium]